jgi:hypothetical protein
MTPKGRYITKIRISIINKILDYQTAWIVCQKKHCGIENQKLEFLNLTVKTFSTVSDPFSGGKLYLRLVCRD